VQVAAASAGVALVVGGMALLFGGLIFLTPVRGGARHVPQESFADSQERIEQHLREMRGNRGEIDNWEEGAIRAARRCRN
jgi:hypothetical protein